MHTGSSHWPARVNAAPNISTVIGSAWLQLLLLKQAQPDFSLKGQLFFHKKIRDNFKGWLRYTVNVFR